MSCKERQRSDCSHVVPMRREEGEGMSGERLKRMAYRKHIVLRDDEELKEDSSPSRKVDEESDGRRGERREELW